MPHYAYIAGSLALRATAPDDVQVQSYGPPELCLEILHQCPEALLLYDRLILPQQIVQGIYHGPTEHLDVQVFRHLVDMELIQGLDPARFEQLSPTAMQEMHVLAEAICAWPTADTRDLTPDMVGGWLLELRLAAARRVRPFTWNNTLALRLTKLLREMTRRTSEHEALTAWMTVLQARFSQTVSGSRQGDLRERLMHDMLTCNSLMASRSASHSGRTAPEPHRPGLHAVQYLVPDMTLVHPGDERATWQALERLLSARAAMPTLRKQLHQLAVEVTAALPPEADTAAARRATQEAMERHLKAARDRVLDIYPKTRGLHRFVSNPYVAWTIGYCLPFADVALLHAATASVTARVTRPDKDSLPTDDPPPEWYFEYLDVRRILPVTGWRGHVETIREWLPL